jgi:hypothetical protein
VDVIGIDGRPHGSVPAAGDGTPAGYRSIPPGTYVLASRRSEADGPPVVRQIVEVLPGRSYTFALFSGAADGSVTTQFTPDEPPSAPRGQGQVRLVEGARETGVVTLAMAAPGGTEIVLAAGVDYGLVTGYAQVPAGEQAIRVRASAREWLLPVAVPSGGAVTLLLTDSPEGPALRAVPDGPAAPSTPAEPNP